MSKPSNSDRLGDILDNARYRVASHEVLKAEIKALMLELIGEDESELEAVNPGFYGSQIRNAQRAILRQKVSEL